MIPDPQDERKVYITTFGGGVWHGSLTSEDLPVDIYKHAGIAAWKLNKRFSSRSQEDRMNARSVVTQSEWQRALTGNQRKAAQLLGRTEAEQKQRGHFHTLKEISQQSWTWMLHTLPLKRSGFGSVRSSKTFLG